MSAHTAGHERETPETLPSSPPATLAPDGQEEELIMHLEPDQLVAATFHPVAPAHLGPRAVFGLWVLRWFAVLVSAMVIYTFIARLS